MIRRSPSLGPLPPTPLGRGVADTTAPEVARRRRLVRLYLLATILLSLMFSLYIWQYTKMIQLRLGIRQALGQTERLTAANAELQAEITKLTSLERIERVARQDLGMVNPGQIRYLRLPPGVAGRGGPDREPGR